MNDKELLLEAIDKYTLYTKAQRNLLKTLVNINVNNIIAANVAELAKLTDINRATIYNCISVLSKEGIVEKIKGPNKGKLGLLKLIPIKLNEIQQIHEKKYKITQKIIDTE